MLDLLDVYEPDTIRFYLTTIFPETSDSVFAEDDLVRTNNDVLIATWGNLANRVISMIHRNFDGIVPETGALAVESEALLADTRAAFNAVGEEYNACHFRNAVQESLRLAQSANRYLDERAPWKAVKTDRAHAAETLATALNVINALKILLHPVVPFSTGRLHTDLGFDGDVESHGWEYEAVPAGTALQPARPLYTKIDLEPAGTAP
jgi:methionyl-tRNA synthetase